MRAQLANALQTRNLARYYARSGELVLERLEFLAHLCRTGRVSEDREPTWPASADVATEDHTCGR